MRQICRKPDVILPKSDNTNYVFDSEYVTLERTEPKKSLKYIKGWNPKQPHKKWDKGSFTTTFCSVLEQ